VGPQRRNESPQGEELEEAEDHGWIVSFRSWKKAIGPAPRRGADPILLPSILFAVPGPDPWRSAGLSIRKILGAGSMNNWRANRYQSWCIVFKLKANNDLRSSAREGGGRRRPSWLDADALHGNRTHG
jgi:hypothetical protein